MVRETFRAVVETFFSKGTDVTQAPGGEDSGDLPIQLSDEWQQDDQLDLRNYLIEKVALFLSFRQDQSDSDEKCIWSGDEFDPAHFQHMARFARAAPPILMGSNEASPTLSLSGAVKMRSDMHALANADVLKEGSSFVTD